MYKLDINVSDNANSSESKDALHQHFEHRNTRIWSSETHTAIILDNFMQDSVIKHDLPENAKPLDYFSLLLLMSFYNTLTVQTNIYAECIHLLNTACTKMDANYLR